jgi:KipI family sensor histidine kinase inhibitor
MTSLKALSKNESPWRMVSSGDSCLVLETPPAARGASSRWLAAAATALRNSRIPGVTDIVSAMTTVGIHYRPESIQCLATIRETPYQAVARQVSDLLQGFGISDSVSTRLVEIPVCYGGEHGPDLESVAETCGLSSRALIDLHAGADVEVQMIGFAPGHPYIGTFDERLAPPRRAQPRTAVPVGSIGLANRQSVIYPFILPGGWNLIGRTPLMLFDLARDPVCLLEAGDRIRFVPISAGEFEAMRGK